MEEHDNEGRVITAEFDKYFLVTAYVPNSGRGLVRLDYRQTWDKDFSSYLKGLDSKKPVILCGDLNVAHQEIDLKNPKTNKKTAGFTAQERDGFGQLLSQGFLDTYRHLRPDARHAYTFWTYLGNCRARNVGWRLDYFVMSRSLLPSLCDSKIRSGALGSDHCPITLLMAM
ncbi:DNA-(apurinic or apyrimidinic site) endonuclease [Stegostoma tigrinum]|uniref:DNA-(apurinic or apyrimidinic site) endonuclease n=1 Tax=Stegostoma tigrinum TaxID=3053191 RepID=UPI0028708B32|nr:DNA-(apurinic or apyrimidinic site) endonuclease [Stegostoma tigrinum]